MLRCLSVLVLILTTMLKVHYYFHLIGKNTETQTGQVTPIVTELTNTGEMVNILICFVLEPPVFFPYSVQPQESAPSVTTATKIGDWTWPFVYSNKIKKQTTHFLSSGDVSFQVVFVYSLPLSILNIPSQCYHKEL